MTRLIILGAGPVGQQLAHLADRLEFQVTVVDHRESLLAADHFPSSVVRLTGEFADLQDQIALSPSDYVAIVSQVWRTDQAALQLLVQRPLAYLGMIGCRRKLAEFYPSLLAQGVPQAALDNIYAPIGIHIGSRTPAEIAVSIAAELVAVRSGKISRPAAT